MNKQTQAVLTVTLAVLVLFLLNYLVTMPTIESYGENLDNIEVLQDELSTLEQNIAQGAELEGAIAEMDGRVTAVGLQEYHDENYSVHNFFVDTAQSFGLEVNSLTIGTMNPVDTAVSEAALASIAQDPLVAGQMTQEEIGTIPSYYEVINQTTSMNVTGTIQTILDFTDALAKEDIYILLPSLTLSDFIDNTEEVTLSLQFVQYSYRAADLEMSTEAVDGEMAAVENPEDVEIF